MENPAYIFPTGMQMAWHGQQQHHHTQNGGAQGSAHVSGKRRSVVERLNNVEGARDNVCIHQPLSDRNSVHNGVIGEEEDDEGLTEDSVDVQKMEDWLKTTRSDSLSMDLDDGVIKSDEFTSSAFVGVEIKSEDDNVDAVDLLENGRLEVLEFREQDKNNTLMTPQELESMPERGLEFEESVGPKELNFEPNLSNSSPSPDDFVYLSPTDLPSVDDGEMSDNEEEEEDEEGEKLDENSSKSNVTYVSQQWGKPQLLTNGTNGATVATISITTDDLNQTITKIIITGQGQGLKFNSAGSVQQQHQQQSSVVNGTTNGELVNVNGGQVLPVLNSLSDTSEAEHQELQYLPESSDILETNGLCNNEKKTWPCQKPGCSRIYDKKCKLKVHLINHLGERPFKCDIDGCDWAFATAYKLKRHIETHEGKKEYICHINGCMKKFTTIYNLKTHKKLHQRPNNVRCPVESCDMMFPTIRKMELHLKNHGGAAAPYKCPLQTCGKEYYMANSISTHMRIHSKGDLLCSFDGCGKKFDKACRLKQHFRQHTGERPYACESEGCGWTFVSASKLTRHMRKHTGERRYRCPEEGCGKSFMRAEHLQGHVVVHSKAKPFKCTHENCNARFTAKSSLYVHLKKHNTPAEKVMHSCPSELCGKKYTCKSSLRLHVLKNHTPVLADNQLDYITLFSNEDLQEMRFSQLDMASGLAVSVPNITIPVAATPNGLTDTVVNPSNFIASATFHPAGDILTQRLSDGIITHSFVMNEEDATNVMSLKDDDGVQILATTPATDDAVTAFPEDESCQAARLLQRHHSGSARTDYCSNHVMAKRRRKCRQQVRLEFGQVVNGAEMNEDVMTKVNLMQNDVVLTTTAIAFRSHSTNSGAQLVQTQLFADDAATVDLYHEDNLLVPITTTGSLLSESPGVGEKVAVDYNGLTMSLKDLE